MTITVTDNSTPAVIQVESGGFAVNANAAQAAQASADSIAASIRPYETRAAVIAATVDAAVTVIRAYTPAGDVIEYSETSALDSMLAVTTNGATRFWRPACKVTPDHYAENTTPGTTDMSAAIISADEAVNSQGGGVLDFFGGTYGAKELVSSNRVTWSGKGRGVTIIKLLDGANTFLLGSSSYVNNESFVNTHITTMWMTFGGNKANNTADDLVAMACYRYTSVGCSFEDCSGPGLVLTTTTRDGVTTTSTNSNENSIRFNDFDRTDGPGLYIRGNTADFVVTENNFNQCGGRNEADLYAERCAGSKIVNNQFYNGGYHCLYVAALGRSIITGNHFDLECNDALSGDRVAGLWVESIVDFAPSVVTGNIYHLASALDSSAIDMHAVVINSNSSGAATFGADSIDDETTQKGATALYAVPAAAAGLDNIKWLQDSHRDIDQGTPLRLEWTGTSESGSNANGEYTRFADGTLICRATLTSFIDATSAAGSIFETTTEETWNYPFDFVDANVSVSFNPRGDNSAWGKGRPNNTTSAKMRLFSATSEATALTVDATAIGRWE